MQGRITVSMYSCVHVLAAINLHPTCIIYVQARRVGAEKGAKDKGNRARINKTTLQLQRQKKGVESRAGKVELSTKKVGNDVV